LCHFAVAHNHQYFVFVHKDTKIISNTAHVDKEK